MKIVSDMAETKDYQLWVEKVDESGQVGIVIEDGMVKVTKYQSPVWPSSGIQSPPGGGQFERKVQCIQ
jgi:hypothetical protein